MIISNYQKTSYPPPPPYISFGAGRLPSQCIHILQQSARYFRNPGIYSILKLTEPEFNHFCRFEKCLSIFFPSFSFSPRITRGECLTCLDVIFAARASWCQVGSITFFCYGGGVLSSSLLIAPRVSWRQHRVSHNTRIKTFDIPKQDTWGF